MSPENHQFLEDVFPIEIVPFRGHVSFRRCKPYRFFLDTVDGRNAAPVEVGSLSH